MNMCVCVCIFFVWEFATILLLLLSILHSFYIFTFARLRYTHLSFFCRAQIGVFLALSRALFIFDDFIRSEFHLLINSVYILKILRVGRFTIIKIWNSYVSP